MASRRGGRVRITHFLDGWDGSARPLVDLLERVGALHEDAMSALTEIRRLRRCGHSR